MRNVVERSEEAEDEIGLYETGQRCERCDFGAFVVLDASGARWKLACVYCNMRAQGPALVVESSRLPTAPVSLSALKFREGRYAGSSLKEIASTVEGVEYLRWYEKSGKSAFMRERVAEFLVLLGQ